MVVVNGRRWRNSRRTMLLPIHRGTLAIASQDGGFVVAVGAPYDGTSERCRNGSVYVYSLSGSGSSFELLQKIVPLELLGGDQFGSSLTVGNAAAYPNDNTNIRETRIAIGARLRDDKGMDSRSVYMYLRRDGESEFSFEQKLIPSEWSPGAEMGTSVDMDQHKVIVGARRNSMVCVERITFNMTV